MDLDSWDSFIGSQPNLSFMLCTHERFGWDLIQEYIYILVYIHTKWLQCITPSFWLRNWPQIRHLWMNIIILVYVSIATQPPSRCQLQETTHQPPSQNGPMTTKLTCVWTELSKKKSIITREILPFGTSIYPILGMLIFQHQ